MVKIVFEAHSTTYWNEQHLATGVTEVALSPLGIQQSHELGQRYAGAELATVYCSERSRSLDTGRIAFDSRNIPIVCDGRLNECHLGTFEGAHHDDFRAMQYHAINTPWPGGGQSYTETTKHMGDFLTEIAALYDDNDTVMIIGHRATQYGLEHWLKGVPLEEAVTAPWKWQPGWTYTLPSTPKPPLHVQALHNAPRLEF